MRILTGFLICALAACGNSGGTGSNSSASCGASFTACGGDATGTWKFANVCGLPLTENGLGQNCPSGTATTSSATLTGSISLNSDKSVSTNITMQTTKGALTLPSACIPMNGMFSSCGDVQSYLNSNGTAMDGTVSTYSCSGTVSTSCMCTVSSSNSKGNTGTGTWSTSGTTLNIADGNGNTVSYDYCIKGSTLALRPPSTGSSSQIWFTLTK